MGGQAASKKYATCKDMHHCRMRVHQLMSARTGNVCKLELQHGPDESAYPLAWLPILNQTKPTPSSMFTLLIKHVRMPAGSTVLRAGLARLVDWSLCVQPIAVQQTCVHAPEPCVAGMFVSLSVWAAT